MYKKLIVFISLIFILAAIAVITGTIVINQRAWKEIKNNFYEEKIELIEYFIEQKIVEMDSLLYSHAVWTEMQEMVEEENTQWLFDNATGYLIDNKDIPIDFVMVTDEYLNYMDYYGDDILKSIINSQTVHNAIKMNEITKELIWINDKPMLLIASPLLDNEYNNPFGSYVLGKWIDNDQIIKLKNILGNKSISKLTITKNKVYDNIIDEKFSSIKFSYKTSLDKGEAYVNVNFDTPVYNKIFVVQKKHIFTIVLITSSICIIICLIYLKKVLNVIIDVIKAVTKISNGEYTARASKTNMKETDLLVDAVNQMAYDITYRIEEIDKNYISMIEIMNNAITMNDSYTSHHSSKVGDYAKLIGEELNFNDLESLYIAGRLHDIGKISIPKEILNKPGKLSTEEYEIIKEHPLAGYQIMNNIEYFNEIKKGVLYHHERYDGKGYPKGLKGDEIPMIAQIISVADVFDALASDRPYRKSFAVEEAINIIKENSGKMFNPIVVEAFIKVMMNNN